MPERAFIGLGSNLGDRVAMLRQAAARLESLGATQAKSGIYESAPLGPPQPDYLNAVVEIATSDGPEEVLDRLLAIEVALGRTRRERWGPRLIDLDLLALGALSRATTRMTVPHPEIPRRAFVLRPWFDIAPDFEVPGLGSVRRLWDALPEPDRTSVRQVAGGLAGA